MSWAKFPTKWIIQDKKLARINWGEHKSNATAALLLLIAMAIIRNRQGLKDDNGLPRDTEHVVATYDLFMDMIPMSRSKVASGLSILLEFGLVERDEHARSVYRLPGLLENGGWAKLPQSHLMAASSITAFNDFNLRKIVELDAVKLYLLFIAFRHTSTGFARIGYDKIEEYTGVAGKRIKRAKSILIAYDLIYVESDQIGIKENGRPPMQYKLIGL